MGGPSRERILERRMQDLLDIPENITDRGSEKGLALLHRDDEVKKALLQLVINRQPEDWQKALDRIDSLRQGVIAYERFVDKEPIKPHPAVK